MTQEELEEFSPCEEERVIYITNTKSSTARYDKLVYKKMINHKWALYINRRTDAGMRFQIRHNHIVTAKPAKMWFKSVPEYFMWALDDMFFTKSDQFWKEYKQVSEKYPEYFI